MQGDRFLKTIQIGPFAAFFTNVNRAMGLPGHSHFATITLQYETLAETGFPAFEGTYRAVMERIRELTEGPLRMTNEAVVDSLWAGFDGWTDPEIERWGGSFRLLEVRLAVRGVPDKLGHADGFTVYAVRREAAAPVSRVGGLDVSDQQVVSFLGGPSSSGSPG